MRTLSVRVESLTDTLAGVAAAWKAAEAGRHVAAQEAFAFPSWETLHDLLNANRMEIVRVMAGKGPMRVRDVAARVGRDIKNVHGDLTRLAKNGMIDKTADGFVFPYDRIHVEFDLEAAA